MYTVATHLVEVKTQQTFSDFLDERFFRPLDMVSTSLQPEAARNKGYGDRIATGYCWDKKSSSYNGFQAPDCPDSQGAGSIITSANDLIKWVKALIHRESPISGRVYQGLIRLRTLVSPTGRKLKRHTTPVIYAAGLEIYYYRGHMVVGHDGGIPGFQSKFFFLPELKFGAVILTNSDGGGSVATILAQELMDEVLRVPKSERPSRKNRKRSDNKNHKSKGSIEVTAENKLPLHPEKKPEETGKGWERREKRQTQDSQLKSPQEIPFDAYTGKYHNAGYHDMTVEIKDQQLFIDATDRSMGFTLTFEHVRDQTEYIAHLSDFYEGGDDPVEAEFMFENGRVVRMGLHLEPALKENIWFDRIEEDMQPVCSGDL